MTQMIVSALQDLRHQTFVNTFQCLKASSSFNFDNAIGINESNYAYAHMMGVEEQLIAHLKEKD